jgi:hypothetical protein
MHIHLDHPDPEYRYPGHLTGPSAAHYPPPPQPGTPEPDHGIEPGA